MAEQWHDLRVVAEATNLTVEAIRRRAQRGMHKRRINPNTGKAEILVDVDELAKTVRKSPKVGNKQDLMNEFIRKRPDLPINEVDLLTDSMLRDPKEPQQEKPIDQQQAPNTLTDTDLLKAKAEATKFKLQAASLKDHLSVAIDLAAKGAASLTPEDRDNLKRLIEQLAILRATDHINDN